MHRSKNNVPLSQENTHRRSLNKSYQKCTVASNYSHAYMKVGNYDNYSSFYVIIFGNMSIYLIILYKLQKERN